LDKAIVTAFMVMVGVVCAVLVFNAVYPAIVLSSDAMTSMKGRIDGRLNSQIEVVHATGELDSNGQWQDTNADGDFDVFVWVKNVGSLRVSALERCDVFFGEEGNFSRIAYGQGNPHWELQLENDTDWNPTATLKITIHYSSALSSGRYFFKMVTPNGVSDEYYFSM